MLDMKKGDLVFCPKAPDYEHFTIAKVAGPYRFEDCQSPTADFGHIIPVNSQKQVSNWHDLDARTIGELFKSAYSRPAVTKVQDYKSDNVLRVATRLMKKCDTHIADDPQAIREQHYTKARRQAAKFLMQSINKTWGFDQFEAAVGEAFRRKGYELIRRKSPDYSWNMLIRASNPAFSCGRSPVSLEALSIRLNRLENRTIEPVINRLTAKGGRHPPTG